MSRDFSLTKAANGRYSLSGTTEDSATKLSTRVVITLLTQLRDLQARGTQLSADVASGLVKNSADAQLLLGVAAVEVLEQLAEVNLDAEIISINVSNANVVSSTAVEAELEVIGSTGLTTINETVGTP